MTYPRPMPSLNANGNLTVAQVAVGKSHIVLLTDVGHVYTQGDGTYGQLGHKVLADAHIPKQVEQLEKIRVLQVAAGHYSSSVLTDAGDILLAGALGTKVKSAVFAVAVGGALKRQAIVKIASGASHMLALTRTGKLYSWGSNKQWQLGHMQTNPEVVGEVQFRVGQGTSLLEGDNAGTVPANDMQVTHIALAERHSLCITQGGRIGKWGQNTH
eukprot:TRINITY_DN3159_c0_g1_i2.p1 TRINITY_DN3159_c0_g1~~TRINITY_DN3159_c0_g1_i2.p1  ORF type:complete len:237 (-),score=27.35 TRINITY_DN3159_c0_g1_i2:50-691(-)